MDHLPWEDEGIKEKVVKYDGEENHHEKASTTTIILTTYNMDCMYRYSKYIQYKYTYTTYRESKPYGFDLNLFL